MYDNHEEAGSVETKVEPEASVPAGSAYRVLFLKIDEEGTPRLWVKPHVLSAKIYDRRTALKYAAFEAQKFAESPTDMVVAVLSPNGRCISVLGRTGKPVRPVVAMRIRRALVTLVPNDVKVKRRTSRPLGRSVTRAAVRKRRTSRR
jgi:hypothetical protein